MNRENDIHMDLERGRDDADFSDKMQRSPEQTALEQTALEQTAPEQTAPEQTAMEQTAPKQMAWEQMAPEHPALQAGYFRALGLPSLVYAVVYTVCMFQNRSGITMPVWIAAAVFYARTVMKKLAALQETETKTALGVTLKKGSGMYIIVLLLLGLSTCLTDNTCIILFNYAGLFLVLPAFLLHNFCDDTRWDFGKYMSEVITAVLGAVGCMLTPFSDGAAFYRDKKRKKNQTFRAVLAGLACAVPGAVVLGAFLADADAVFASIAVRLFSGLRIPMNIFRIFLMILFGFFSAYCGMRFLVYRSRHDVYIKQRKFPPAAAMAFTAVIAVMYLIFCAIQVFCLFAGNMRLPEGMTYAAYARSGFFQLLFVCIVNFIMVVLLNKYFERQKGLVFLLLVICGCTFVMNASSAYRMFLYISVYHLTFLRVVVLTSLAALALLTVGAVFVLVSPGFSLFRYSAAVVCIFYLGFSFSHVDYYIAAYNLAQAETDSRNTDWWYLGSMSMDAAPAIAEFYEEAPKEIQSRLDGCALRAKNLLAQKNGYYSQNGEWAEDEMEYGWYFLYMKKVYEAEQTMGLRNFNVSRYLAVLGLERV